MPRSGVNGTYSLPPNTNNQAPNTPISSSMFNAFASDVQQTFNDPTPVAYGGTGQSELVLPSDEFGIKDGSNGTKRVDFDLSGISASTTRTLTIQDADGTIALLSDIGSLQQDVSDLLNGAVRGDIDQTGKDETWRDQAKANLGVPFRKSFVSDPITIVTGGASTLSHELGEAPSLVTISARCVSASDGFVVGEEIALGTIYNTTSSVSHNGASIRSTETQIHVRIASTANPIVYLPSTGDVTRLANSNFRLIVRAWA